MVSKSATAAFSSYNNTTDSLEALRDNTDTQLAVLPGIVVQKTTIATLTSQTDFTLAAGSADNNAYNNQLVLIQDQSTAAQVSRVTCQTYTGSTKRVQLYAAPAFTVAAGDVVYVLSLIDAERLITKLGSKPYLAMTNNSSGALQIDDATGNYPGAVGSVTGNVAGSVNSVVTSVACSSLTDKTNMELAATGLDAIPTTQPAGLASNFREMIVQTWRRFFKRVTKSGTQIKTYKDDNTTVATTQSYTSDDDTGPAS